MSKYDFDLLVQSARDSNLADYFLQSGYTTERHGAEVYIKEFPGLCVNTKSNKWYSHYEAVGGSNSIDCLVKICGHDFKQAVLELTGCDIPRFTPEFPPKLEPIKSARKDLQMPPPGENMRRVFAYFCKERKIPAEVVEELVQANLLYQSAGQVATTVNGITQIAKPPNAVFVHRDENGVAIGGEVQGVNSYRRYKGLVTGTGDSVFVFTPKSGNKCGEAAHRSSVTLVFESGIDLMSFYALADKQNLQGVSLISMAGLKPSVPKRLQAEGMLVLSFVDNDEAGRKFEQSNGFKRGCDTLERAGVKDWNDALRSGVVKSGDVVIDDVQSTAKGGIRK